MAEQSTDKFQPKMFSYSYLCHECELTKRAGVKWPEVTRKWGGGGGVPLTGEIFFKFSSKRWLGGAVVSVSDS